MIKARLGYPSRGTVILFESQSNVVPAKHRRPMDTMRSTTIKTSTIVVDAS